MRAHSLESNFAFQKSLSVNKNLANIKFDFYELITLREIEFSYRQLQYKKHADEFKVGIVKSNKIKLTEYKNGIESQTLKIKI